MRSPEIKEDVDTFVTEVIHFINVKDLEVVAAIGQRHQTSGVEVTAVEQVEVGQFWKVSQKLSEGEIWTAVTTVAPLHFVTVSITV